LLSLKHSNFVIDESKLFAEFSSNKIQHGKKIYVGLFKKKDEYFKIKQDKEGKASNLYVKNFGNNFGDRDLFNLFKSFGSIKSAKVRRQKCGLIEKPLGCGFVDFENPEEAEMARIGLNGKTLQSGRIISVTYADCKSRRMRKKLEENAELNANQTVTGLNSNTNMNFMNQTILNNVCNNKSINFCNKENESPSNSPDILSPLSPNVEQLMFNVNNNTNSSCCSSSSSSSYENYDYNENRFRSDSTSSETSFDLILTDWSERWNRQLLSEYRLFY
jgi:RNA recognition motif-containing protein